MPFVHTLISDIPKPKQFTYPFCYEPHPLCIEAVELIKQEIAHINPHEGKMFGVLVVETEHKLGFLAAYSGLLEGRNDWPYFVPPVFDAQKPDGYFKAREREIMQSEQHKQMSQDLQLWLFHQYQFLNANGEQRDLVDIWQDYHSSPRIRKKFPLPPGGTGDCCAPKLLQYAYSKHLKPICMAEFWWGPSPKSEVRHHGLFYPACRGKCKPILTWMLQGLDVEPNPEEMIHPHLNFEVIYEDDALAVINKPSGLLSVPGKAYDYSVATIAQERWPGSMVVHRLDMGTSGLMIIAKSKATYVPLQEQFVKHMVEKRYIALLEGLVTPPLGRIELPLLSDPLNRPRQIVDYRHGKSAVTEYEVLSTSNEPLTTLIALYPHTGRTHQLRVHCAHPNGLDCPIVGDELYGRKAERLCLHCDQIRFAHPISGERMYFELPNPFV